MNELQTSGDGTPELRRMIHEVLVRSPYDPVHVRTELTRLLPGGDVSVLVTELAGLELDPAEGIGHWQAAVDRQQEMAARLGRPVDLRAALLDWLLEAQALREPKFVEVQVFDELRNSVHRDGLTGLYNFRFFSEHLSRELQRCSRRMAPVSLVMIDVDEFKKYNDRHGHDAGNRALIAVARVLTDAMRRNDVCARYGGEEFAIVMSDTTKAHAVDAVERVRHRIERRCAEIADIELPEPLTISAGVATYPADATEPTTLVQTADAALYEAKSSGRNRVVAHGNTSRSFRRSDLGVRGRLRSMREWEEEFHTSSVGDAGFSMVLSHALDVGDVIEVALEPPDGGEAFCVTGRVAYVRENGPDSFDTGVSLIDVDAGKAGRPGSLLDGLQATTVRARTNGA